MITIQVLWKNSGVPAPKQKVYCCFGRRWGDNKTADVNTNDSGEAFFEVTGHNGEVYINGFPVYRGIMEKKIVVYLDDREKIN